MEPQFNNFEQRLIIKFGVGFEDSSEGFWLIVFVEECESAVKVNQSEMSQEEWDRGAEDIASSGSTAREHESLVSTQVLEAITK